MTSRCPSTPVASVAKSHILNNNVDVLFTFTQLNKQVKLDVNVNKDFKNLTDKYTFHIHESPVTLDCKSTKLHYDPKQLNPNGNSTTYNCIKTDINTCEVGDLSGRFGKLESKVNKYSFLDSADYTVDGIIDHRSIVIHNFNKDRIGCANITRV